MLLRLFLFIGTLKCGGFVVYLVGGWPAAQGKLSAGELFNVTLPELPYESDERV